MCAVYNTAGEVGSVPAVSILSRVPLSQGKTAWRYGRKRDREGACLDVISIQHGVRSPRKSTLPHGPGFRPYCPTGPGNGTVWWDTLLLWLLYLNSFVLLSHHLWNLLFFVPSVSVLSHVPLSQKKIVRRSRTIIPHSAFKKSGGEPAFLTALGRVFSPAFRRPPDGGAKNPPAHARRF
jgi:hypothetical protein